MVVRRLAEQRLEDYTRNFRVVVVNGPRQSGKTTLLRLRNQATGGEFRSLDDDAWLSAALNDPKTFVEHAELPLYLDEVQRGGDALVRAVKYAVDLDNRRGRFVLSGSTRFLTVPTLSESLAGRVGILELFPLTVAERTEDAGGFLAHAMQDASALLAPPSPWSRQDYIELMCAGGFPEVLEIDDSDARRDWFASYIATVIGRDIEQFAAIRDVSLLAQTLSLVAGRSGSPLVIADLARSLELGHTTVRDYLSYVETVFLTTRVGAWSTNLTAKVVKTPKVFITDPGLAAYLLRVDSRALARPGHPALGGIAETFAVTELTRLAAGSRGDFQLSYFRDRGGQEIDLIIEDWAGNVTAIEVKASQTPTANDARHLRWMRDKLGERFKAGIVLHLGAASLSFGDRIFALPFSALWGHRSLA